MSLRVIQAKTQPTRCSLQPRGAAVVRASLVMLLATSSLAGCIDGPFYAMKRVNPFFQKEFKKDRALAPTFDDRMQELTLLESRLPSMAPETQQAWARQLEVLITKEPSPEMRARATKVVAKLPFEEAIRALNSASADESEKVRLAACSAWKVRGDAAARDMLLSLSIRADETTSVRQAAIDALSVFDDGEVFAQMSRLLDDRSPAIQFQVARSLKSMTGRDYGGDFASWKEFLAGNDVPPPAPKSLTATLWDSLPSFR
jgi:hypothetical protein